MHFIFRYELLYNLVYTIQTVASKDKAVYISYILILIHSKQFKLSRSTVLQGLSSCTCRFKTVHDPVQAPQKYIDKYSFIENKTRRTYAAMLDIVDEAIGNVTRSLEKAG